MPVRRTIIAVLAALVLVLILASLCAGVAMAGELLLPDWVLDRMLHMLLVPMLFVAVGLGYPRLRAWLRLAVLLPVAALCLAGGFTLFEIVGLPGAAWPAGAVVLAVLWWLLVRRLGRPPAPLITVPRSHLPGTL